MKITYLLTGEGSSDLLLQSHIEHLLIQAGFNEVSGEAPDISQLAPGTGRTVAEKIKVLLRYFPDADVIFYHRDADNAGVNVRIAEITNGAEGLLGDTAIVPIVPVRELETWLLADSEAIKAIAGNKNGKFVITCLKEKKHLENIANPKSLLMDALCEASQTEGGRLAKFKKRFGEMRARLAIELNPDGPVTDLPSYKDFRQLLSNFAAGRLDPEI